jgi:hypothetical protein
MERTYWLVEGSVHVRKVGTKLPRLALEQLEDLGVPDGGVELDQRVVLTRLERCTLISKFWVERGKQGVLIVLGRRRPSVPTTDGGRPVVPGLCPDLGRLKEGSWCWWSEGGERFGREFDHVERKECKEERGGRWKGDWDGGSIGESVNVQARRSYRSGCR